jgi:hypothetical protein
MAMACAKRIMVRHEFSFRAYRFITIPNGLLRFIPVFRLRKMRLPMQKLHACDRFWETGMGVCMGSWGFVGVNGPDLVITVTAKMKAPLGSGADNFEFLWC